VPLNRQLAQAIMLKYASEEDSDMIVPVSKSTSDVLDQLGSRSYFCSRLIYSHRKRDLALTLDTEVQKFDGSCFVKLNTRSPKDFGYSNLNLRGKYLFGEILDEVKKAHPEKTLDSLDLANEVVCAFVRTQNLSLEARSGGEALHFLTHSERINVDLNRALTLSRSVKQFPSSILIRRFVADLDPAYEFRCFVYK
jgi:DNA-directed RNA polymerase subunit N (RpoN/RPB10)